MAVTFIIGRAGSGKTQRCLSHIASAVRAAPLGDPIFLLVPRQATFLTERRLTCELGAFTRVRVVSFDELGRQIASDCGESAVPEVTSIGRQMILGHLLRQNQTSLQYFASVARRPGLAAELDATFDEFERSGKTTEDLVDLIDHLKHATDDAQGPSLVAKMKDLHLLYKAYVAYLGQERLDQHRRLTQVLEKIEQCKLVKHAAVYVDGFSDFTDYERKVLAGLGKTCSSVHICLMMDPSSPTLADPHHLPNELSLFHHVEQTYRRLWFAMQEAHVKVTEPVRLTEQHRFQTEALARVERELFAVRSARATPVDEPCVTTDCGVRLLELPDPAAEVDAVAREIRSLLRQDGWRFRDITVLVRSLDTYHGLIDRSFREHGIPYFVDRRRTAAHHPLLQFVRSMLQIARGNWPHPAVMALLKSGLADVSLLQADEIEAYLLQHRLRGRPWDDRDQWAFQRAAPEEASDIPLPEQFEMRTVNEMRQSIAARLHPLLQLFRGNRPASIRALATEIFQTLARFEVRQRIAKWIDEANERKDLEQAGEHGQVWAEMVSLFDQMVGLLGTEPVTPSEFVDVLEAGLERFDLAITPPTVDQVLVGQVDRTRTPPLRAAIVLGLNEGEFPSVCRDETILSHAERRELQKQKVELDPDVQRRQLDEPLLAYIAFTRASEHLIVTRPMANASGRPCGPSPFWNELRRIVPEAQPMQIARESGDGIDQIATPRQLVVALMRWARGKDKDGGESARSEPVDGMKDEGADAALASLYDWLASYKCAGDGSDPIERIRHRTWSALSYRNDATLSPALASALFPSPLRASAAEMETMAACPFRHFLRYGLRLTDRAAVNFTALDMSTVYHEVLDIVVADMLEQKRDWTTLAPDDAGEMVRMYSRAVSERLRGELMLDNARSQYMLGRIERTLEQVIASVKEMLGRGKFRPAFASVRFGEGKKLPPYRVQTPAGGEATISGSIDRIDLLTEGPDAGAAVVFDYKLAGGALPMGNLYHGLSLQLLTYLLVLQSSGEQLAGRPLQPAATFAYRLLRGLGSVDHPDDAIGPDDPNFHLRAKPRGVFDGRFFPALDAECEPGSASAVVAARIRKDGQFGYRDQSDVADATEFASLLHFVRTKLGHLADEIMAGKIDIAPYRIGKTTPCPRCEFRPICRFEPSQGYHHLTPLKRQDALDRICGRQRDEA